MQLLRCAARRTLLAACFCLSLAYLPAAAQETVSAALDRAALLERVRLRHPSVAAGQSAVEAARAAVRQAGLRPPLELEVEAGIEDFQLLESIGVFVEQELEPGGKRRARVRVAEAEILVAELERLATIRELQAGVSRLYVEVFFGQRLVEVRRSVLDLAEQQVALTRKRVALGDAPAVEVAQLETESALRLAAAERAEGERAAAAAALASLVGEPQGAALRVSAIPESPAAQQDGEALVQRALEQRPEVRAASARRQVREAEIGLARVEAVPNVTVGAGLARERLVVHGEDVHPPHVFETIDDTSYILGLRVRIPLAGRGRTEPAVQRATALVEQARLEEEALRLRVASEVREAWQRLQAARAVRSHLRQDALPRAKRVLDIIQRAYALGARTVLDTLTARESFVRIQEEELQAARDEARATADLEAAVGDIEGGKP